MSTQRLDFKIDNEKLFEAFHLAPQFGLLNDPNGLIYFKGYYHVFYQWNPKALDHKYKVWGHFISKDLKNWHREPIALSPSAEYDSAGIYSGTAFIHDEYLYVVYTGNIRDSNGESCASHQNIARSVDGLKFEKLGEMFPHPKGYTRHVRDPKVWRAANGQWQLILGAQKADTLTGDIILYQSNDLKNWQFRGSILGSQLPNYRGYMLECPDLIDFGKQQVLMFSLQGHAAEGERFKNIHNTGYVVGNFDHQNGVFNVNTNYQEFDYGFEYYAPQTMNLANNKHLIWGWMGIMPAAVEESLPTKKDNWMHILSQPRELVLEQNHLYQLPIIETKELFKQKQSDQVMTWEAKLVPQYVKLTNVVDFELKITENLVLELSNNKLTLLRISWHNGMKEVRTVEALINTLEIFIDNSTVEIFVNNGQYAFSARFFGDVKIINLKARQPITIEQNF